MLAFQFIKPAPPDSVVMATGSEEGAYQAFAKRYAAYLAREGIELQLRTTAGSVENLALLRSGEVELGFIQGGVDDQQTEPELTSLGSVYYEPLWMFHRADVGVDTLRDLRGQMIAVGPAGSGTRALAGRLLRDNGVVAEDLWSPLSGQAAIDALRNGDVAAVFLAGRATDYCVKFTALDAASLGYSTSVLLQGTRSVDPATAEETKAELEAAGVRCLD